MARLACEFESGPQTVTVPFFPLNALFTGSLILGSTQTLRSKSKETKTITTSIAPVQSVEEIRPKLYAPSIKGVLSGSLSEFLDFVYFVGTHFSWQIKNLPLRK